MGGRLLPVLEVSEAEGAEPMSLDAGQRLDELKTRALDLAQRCDDQLLACPR